LISYKKNPATTFIQFLRTKIIKNKIKNKYSEKNTKKEEIFFYLCCYPFLGSHTKNEKNTKKYI
jgi:hypothetical protein